MNIRLLYSSSAASALVRCCIALFFLNSVSVRASAGSPVTSDSLAAEVLVVSSIEGGRPNPILQIVKLKQKKNRQIAAAVLAFPFPFGIVGLHRIYLGTAPHVPIVYIATLGGVFGVLPFIDFCILVLDKSIDRYVENKNVFMWVE